MHVYAFGSVCRGEITLDSDVDLLALVEGHDPRFSQHKYSIYSYKKIKKMWQDGSPFAWHLFLESRLLYGSDGEDFLQSLGAPAKYQQYVADCLKFLSVFETAQNSLKQSRESKVFDLSAAFLSIRNISTCYSLGVLGLPNFSRHAALSLVDGGLSLPLTPVSYGILERARILCTRSIGRDISDAETDSVVEEFGKVDSWMRAIVEHARQYERIH
ncbi:MAG TPA: nucleotidyltransferase domain-containing protein [Edaphobacter sp.]|nr:nucleotidyltransferase domain-containing protein [Edaphobacter sp.]